MENKYKNLGKNSLFVFIGNFGGKAIQFFMLPFYTSWLSTSDYGAVDMITAYSFTLYDVLTLCIASAIFIFPKDTDFISQRSYFTSGLVYSCLPVFCIASIIGLISTFFRTSPNVFFDYTSIIIIIAIVNFLQLYMQNFLRCINKMKVFSLIGIILALSTAMSSFALIPAFGLMGYVYAVICANIITLIYTLFAGKLFLYFDLNSINWRKYREMLSYSIPLVVNVAVTFSIQYLNRPLMEQYQTMDNVGTFAVIQKFPAIIATMIPVFCLAWQVSVLDEFGKDGYRKFYNNVLLVTTIILMAGLIILIPLSKYLILLFAAEQYHDYWIYMPIISLSCVFSYWGYFSGCNFSADKKSKYFLYSGLVTAALSVLINVILISQFELLGTCLSVLLIQIVFALSRFVYSRRYVKMDHIQNYIVMFALYSVTTFLAVKFDNDFISISAALASLILIAISNRSLMPQVYNQIKIIVKKR